MRILVLGGTQFLGRHFVEMALSAGHSVDLFHRHQSNLFPNAIHLYGDRNTDLRSLDSGSWDVTVDFSAYLPRQVRTLAEHLRDRAGSYIFLSTTAVYDTPVTYGHREDGPLVSLPDPKTEKVTEETYGGLKVLCEQAAVEVFQNPLIIRPTYIVGPWDYTARLAYWVQRIARGGEILAPGPADALFQFIDVRDIAQWMTRLLGRGVSGAFHVANPFPPTTFEEVLGEISKALGRKSPKLTWVDRRFLLDAGLDGNSLPLWPGANPEGLLEALDPGKALSEGLTLRPISETIRDFVRFEAAQPTAVRSALSVGLDTNAPIGLEPHVEARLLGQWKGISGNRP